MPTSGSSIPPVLPPSLFIINKDENHYYRHCLLPTGNADHYHPIEKFPRFGRRNVCTFHPRGFLFGKGLKDHVDIQKCDDSDSPEVEHPDVECFEALPDDTVEAIGSTGSAIRKIIRENKETIDVEKYIRFTNIPPATADKFSSRNTRQIFNRSTRYMTIKLLTGAHETALSGGAVQNEIYNVGLDESIRPLRSTTIYGVFYSKEADAAYGPAQSIPGRNPKWPTVVVEVGVSESYRKLRADAEWWLTNSRGDMKLGIIVSISRKTPNIKFETVALDLIVNSFYVPKIRQTITASRDANKPNSQITIRPAVPLVIGFEELFCRQPVPPEHNIELSPDRLGRISKQLWGEQEF